VRDPQCLRCGRLNPGLWGYAPLLRRFGRDFGVGGFLLGTCVVLYLASIALDPSQIFAGGVFGFLGPSTPALVVAGASGYGPVVELGRWWTVLTAGWLHAGLLHILFNGIMLRRLAGDLVAIYGPGRTIIVFVLSSVTGFLASTFSVFAPAVVTGLLRPGYLTVGASAGLLGFLGALVVWAQRTGNRAATSQIGSNLVMLAIFGFLVQGVDNWAHLGGFLGGWVVARVLDPLQPERGNHLVIALALLLVTALAFAANVLTATRLLG
jgi:rhomboid protease GluP